jgi:hypothetical protein
MRSSRFGAWLPRSCCQATDRAGCDVAGAVGQLVATLASRPRARTVDRVQL